MASVKFIVLLVLIAVAMAAANPLFFGPKHEHHIIHVPQHIHTVNHHIISKVPVPVYVEKPVFIEKDFHAGWW